jgi:hypothetical protein
MERNTEVMYDVIYIDAHGSETPVAQHVDDRDEARDVARQAAAERGAGRMMLPGSTKLPNCVCVVPVPVENAA